MRKVNLSTIIMVFFGVLLLALPSCIIEDPEDLKNNGDSSVIDLTISNLTPGYFDLTWDQVDGANWYYLKIEKNGIAISDWYNGSIGLQSGLITDGIAKESVSGDVKTGETYTITVTATDYLINGVTKAVGTKEVTMPALPSEIMATWTSTGYIGNNWTFNSDGTISTLSTITTYTMTWTIENTYFVVVRHFSTNDQIDRYDYKISDDGNTLTLTQGSNEYILTKSKSK